MKKVLSDLNEYGKKHFKSCWYFSVVFDTFWKVRWLVRPKKYIKQTKNSLGNFITLSKRKPKLVENDEGVEFVRNICNDTLQLEETQSINPYTSKGAVFRETFNRTFRKFRKNYVFEKPILIESMKQNQMKKL